MQVVNNGGFRQLANITLTGVPSGAVNRSAHADVLTGAFPEIENSLDEPKNVSVFGLLRLLARSAGLLFSRVVGCCSELSPALLHCPVI